MKNKIVGIVILMLVATTVVSATNINVKETIQMKASKDVLSCNTKIINYQPQPIIPGLNWGVDQKQTFNDGAGFDLQPPSAWAQSFIPTKDKLTAVSLAMFQYGIAPEAVITVSIRATLNSSDLVTITRNTSVDPIGHKLVWILFDFEDISITTGSTYYIVCSANAGYENNTYCWGFASVNDKYIKGEAWVKENETADWIAVNQWDPTDYPKPDFCFKTYFRKPLDISVPINNEYLINPRLLTILERFPNMFPILQHLLG